MEEKRAVTMEKLVNLCKGRGIIFPGSDIYGGMGISLGRLREDSVFDYKFVGLSHNTLRGAAGGAVLIAELLYRKGYLTKK